MASVERIYRQHRQSLFTLALTITGCRQTAEDAVHEAFCRIGRTSLDSTTDPVAYVFTAVRNASIDAHRRVKRQNRLSESIFNGYTPPAQASPDDGILTAERDRILRRAIDGLSGQYRETVILKIFADLTFKQIGEVVGLPMKTVATRYRRALHRLAERLDGQI